jgi:hypothetical protein
MTRQTFHFFEISSSHALRCYDDASRSVFKYPLWQVGVDLRRQDVSTAEEAHI